MYACMYIYILYIYTVWSKSSRTKAIKTKKRSRVFFSLYLFKIESIRCNTQVSTCFQLLHDVRKFFCGNLVQLVRHGLLNPFNCIKSCTLQLQLQLRKQEVVGRRKIWRVWVGGGSMLRLDFESETVELLLPNAPGRCRAGGKNHKCGTGLDGLVECGKLGGLTHLYNILH